MLMFVLSHNAISQERKIKKNKNPNVTTTPPMSVINQEAPHGHASHGDQAGLNQSRLEVKDQAKDGPLQPT